LTERQELMADLAELVRAVNIIAEQITVIAHVLGADLIEVEGGDEYG
jgi:hypothetical protein